MVSQASYAVVGPAIGNVAGVVPMPLDVSGVPQPVSAANPLPTSVSVQVNTISGTVGIDQTAQGTTNGVVVRGSVGAASYNTAANTAGHQVKNASGVLYGLSVNTAGLVSSVTLYDGTSTSGAKLGTFSTLSQGGPVFPSCGIAFATGLYLVAAGATPADITVLYL